MNTAEVLGVAQRQLETFAASGYKFDMLTLGQPKSHQAAVETAKIISKLSPIIGNIIEFSFADVLNQIKDLQAWGTWKRQDPGFPDTILDGKISPQPGFEIKAWFPLATEITARFKDSELAFTQDNIRVALLAWLPEHLIFGQPKLIDVCVVSGKSVAEARDVNYSNPPDYLIIEPEDTATRTRNLQQTNTNGYKFQGTRAQLEEAKKVVATWGNLTYSPAAEYQAKLRALQGRFPYRLDTNYAKMDRIEHDELEAFKLKVLGSRFEGMTIREWSRVLYGENESAISREFTKHLKI